MAVRKFYLISKNTRLPFSKYKKKTILLSDIIPHSVDEIVVEKKGSKRKRKITTFRNINGEIIERIYDYQPKPLKILFIRTMTILLEIINTLNPRLKMNTQFFVPILVYIKSFKISPKNYYKSILKSPLNIE